MPSWHLTSETQKKKGMVIIATQATENQLIWVWISLMAVVILGFCWIENDLAKIKILLKESSASSSSSSSPVR